MSCRVWEQICSLGNGCTVMKMSVLWETWLMWPKNPIRCINTQNLFFIPHSIPLEQGKSPTLLWIPWSDVVDRCLYIFTNGVLKLSDGWNWVKWSDENASFLKFLCTELLFTGSYNSQTLMYLHTYISGILCMGYLICLIGFSFDCI